MKNKLKKIIFNIAKQIILGLVIFAMVFPYSTLVALADPVPVKEVGWNREWNFRTSEYTNSMVELMGEIMGPIYQLATPGSYLTKDIYRYLMKHTESELGIDKDFFRRMQKKVAAPTVDIVFAPTNPKDGEKVTAFAIPHGFRNSNDKMYFTWYIVHDGKTDVKAGRDEAMSMVARGGYDKELFGKPKGDDGDRDAYNVSAGGDDGVGKKSGKATSEDCLECDCLHDMTMFAGLSKRGCFDDKGGILYSKDEEFGEAILDRGMESAKTSRGVVNSEWISRCYRHNFGQQSQDGTENSGRDLVISCHHAFNESLGTSDGTFDAGKEDLWGTNAEDADTDGDGVMDEADLVGLGQNEFTWIYRKGDRVSVAVEGISNIAINEGATDRLRYKNKNWKGDDRDLDLSPLTSPEQWYKDKRGECQKLRETSSNNDYSDCMKELWEHELKTENDEDAFGEMTGYYKIMWAAPGICSKEAKELNLENDWCDHKDDYGFQYLKLYDPVERGAELLEVSVNVSPKNPQFKLAENGDYAAGIHSDSTDMIVASANVSSQDYINPDYLYYKWSVWVCDPNDFDECKDMTKKVHFKSREEGMGLRDIGFYPTNDIFGGNLVTLGGRALVKVGVIVKKHKNSEMSSPGVNGEYTKQIFTDEKKNINDKKKYTQKYAYTASSLVEVSKHLMSIKLYQAEPVPDGSWIKGKEICGSGSKKDVYRKICPVYQYQVLMAEVENAGDGISWQLNGKTLGRTLNGLNNQNPNSKTIFFPITGVDGEVGTIKVISDIENNEGQWEDNNISEARVFSVHRPMAKIYNNKTPLDTKSIRRAYSGAYNGGKGYYRKYANNELWWMAAKTRALLVFSTKPAVVDVEITMVPKYLQDEVDSVNLIVNRSANKQKMASLPKFTGETSTFKNVIFDKSKKNEVNEFKVRTIRQFSEEHKKALKQSFGIAPLDELVHDLNIGVKAISSDDYFEATGKKMALNMKQKTNKFFASTIENAPEYFVFILRLAISFVLMGMMSFGLIRGARKIN